MKKRISILSLMMTIIFAFTACAKAEVKDTEGKLSVGVTIYPLKYFAERIGGDNVEVFSIIADGADAHTFDPKPKDLASLTNTDIFIYNGLGMEEWIDSVLSVVDGTSVKVLEASNGIEALPAVEDDHDHAEETAEESTDHSHDGETKEEHAEYSHDGETEEEHAEHSHDEEVEESSDNDNEEVADEDHDHDHGEFDPHVWLSLDLAIIQANNIKNAIIELDPENEDYYKANFESLLNDLTSLKDEYTEKFNALENKKFVTGHAAFAYLCNEFGLTQSSISDVFGEGELTAKYLEELINYTKENNVKVIFSESTASTKEAETLAKEAGATVEKIYSIETQEDDLDYLEAMRYNLDKIYETLSK